MEAYANLTRQEPPAEVIYVSLDQDETAFEAYRQKMTWPAVPFRDARRALLQLGLQVKSIPALVLLDPQGKVLTSSGVSELMTDPSLARYPYKTSGPVDLAAGLNVERLQRMVTLVAFTDGCDASTKDAVRRVLKEQCEASDVPVLLPRSQRAEVAFATLEEAGKLNDALRMLCSLPPSEENILHVVIIDLAREEYVPLSFAASESDDLEVKVKSAINGLVSGYRDYSIKVVQMPRLPTEAPGATEESATPEEEILSAPLEPQP